MSLIEGGKLTLSEEFSSERLQSVAIIADSEDMYDETIKVVIVKGKCVGVTLKLRTTSTQCQCK